MKRSEVKPGVVAMLSLGGRRGAVAVTVIELISRASVVCAQPLWLAVTSDGRDYHVTARQLRPLPVTDAAGKVIGYAGGCNGECAACGGIVKAGECHGECSNIPGHSLTPAKLRRCNCGRAASGIEECPFIMCEHAPHPSGVSFWNYCFDCWLLPDASGGPSAAERTGTGLPDVLDFERRWLAECRAHGETQRKLMLAHHELGEQSLCDGDCSP